MEVLLQYLVENAVDLFSFAPQYTVQYVSLVELYRLTWKEGIRHGRLGTWPLLE